jgi:Fe-S cluster assembly protein SufD
VLSTTTAHFDGAAAAALGGPAWLVDRRLAAAEHAAEAGLPTTDEEVWRYSRIGELDLDRYGLADGPPAADAIARGERVAAGVRGVTGDSAGLALLVDGHLVSVDLPAELATQGVRLGRLVDLDPTGALFAEVAGEPVDVFGHLNTAFTVDPVLLDIPAGVVVAAPIVIVDWIDGADTAVFPRLLVRVGEDAEVSLVEWQASEPNESLTVPIADIAVGRSARVRHAIVQDRAETVWQIGRQSSTVERDGSFMSTQAALGGHYARSRTDCRLVGRGSSGNLNAIYFAHHDQMLDFRTFQVHAAPDTTSNLLFKGAVDDQSSSVYTGLIRVERQARGTNAFQTNRNLKLADGAWAESVPNLEIENNDVQCSHASTVGPIDEDQRFYLESRGVPTPVAERLIVSGFFEEVLSTMAPPGLASLLRERIGKRLSAGEDR